MNNGIWKFLRKLDPLMKNGRFGFPSQLSSSVMDPSSSNSPAALFGCVLNCDVPCTTGRSGRSSSQLLLDTSSDSHIHWYYRTVPGIHINGLSRNTRRGRRCQPHDRPRHFLDTDIATQRCRGGHVLEQFRRVRYTPECGRANGTR